MLPPGDQDEVGTAATGNALTLYGPPHVSEIVPPYPGHQ